MLVLKMKQAELTAFETFGRFVAVTAVRPEPVYLIYPVAGAVVSKDSLAEIAESTNRTMTESSRSLTQAAKMEDNTAESDPYFPSFADWQLEFAESWLFKQHWDVVTHTHFYRPDWVKRSEKYNKISSYE